MQLTHQLFLLAVAVMAAATPDNDAPTTLDEQPRAAVPDQPSEIQSRSGAVNATRSKPATRFSKSGLRSKLADAKTSTPIGDLLNASVAATGGRSADLDSLSPANERQNQVTPVVGNQGPYDITGIGGGLYEPQPLPGGGAMADTRFTIQNVFSGEYLYVDDSKGVDDSVVQTGSVETIQSRHSNHALFRLDWNEDLNVRIICVDNDVMLTGTLAPHVEQHPVAPVIASRAPSAAALWSIGEISWAPDTGETMFIINHKYTDFLFAIGDPSKKKPALTTRHVKYYGLARSRWIVRPFHD